jgi:hypothetical protein
MFLNPSRMLSHPSTIPECFHILAPDPNSAHIFLQYVTLESSMLVSTHELNAPFPVSNPIKLPVRSFKEERNATSVP